LASPFSRLAAPLVENVIAIATTMTVVAVFDRDVWDEFDQRRDNKLRVAISLRELLRRVEGDGDARRRRSLLGQVNPRASRAG
jgi:hypothetical protein